MARSRKKFQRQPVIEPSLAQAGPSGRRGAPQPGSETDASIAPGSRISVFPRCAARLKWNATNLHDPLMTEYWAAVIVADFCDDEALTDFGGFDFDDRSTENGNRLLARLEDCIRQKKHKVASFEPSKSLIALLGARGVRTSELKTEDDYWVAAEILFGRLVDGKRSVDLEKQIASVPKKTRKALANGNLHRLPSSWISKAPIHQAKLQQRVKG